MVAVGVVVVVALPVLACLFLLLFLENRMSNGRWEDTISDSTSLSNVVDVDNRIVPMKRMVSLV